MLDLPEVGRSVPPRRSIPRLLAQVAMFGRVFSAQRLENGPVHIRRVESSIAPWLKLAKCSPANGWCAGRPARASGENNSSEVGACGSVLPAFGVRSEYMSAAFVGQLAL